MKADGICKITKKPTTIDLVVDFTEDLDGETVYMLKGVRCELRKYGACEGTCPVFSKYDMMAPDDFMAEYERQIL